MRSSRRGTCLPRLRRQEQHSSHVHLPPRERGKRAWTNERRPLLASARPSPGTHRPVGACAELPRAQATTRQQHVEQGRAAPDTPAPARLTPRTRRLRPGSRTVNNAELSRRWVSASWHEPVSQTRGRSWHEGGLPRAAPESSSREVAGGHRAGTGRGALTRGRGWPLTALGAGTALRRCPEAGRGARFGAHASARHGHGPPPTCKHSLGEDAPCAKGVPAEGEWPGANVGGMDTAPAAAPRTPLERARGPATTWTDAGPTAARPVPSGSGSVTLAPRGQLTTRSHAGGEARTPARRSPALTFKSGGCVCRCCVNYPGTE